MMSPDIQRKLNDCSICFIICVNSEQYEKECLLYLSRIQVPDGYTMDVLTVKDAVSMTAGYNEAMNSSDAKYKVYLHQDVFLRNRRFIYDILDIFTEKSIGMIGMVGTADLSNDGVMWNGSRCGSFQNIKDMMKSGAVSGFTDITCKYQDVVAIDGLLMATQYDIPWREDLFTGWDFYDISQSGEFLRAGYRVVAAGQQPKSWFIHDCGTQSLWNYEIYRKIFLKEYKDTFKIDLSKIRVLQPYTKEIQISDISWALIQLGYEPIILDCGMHLDSYSIHDTDVFSQIIKKTHSDIVFTHDFSPFISRACLENQIPYIAWTWDTPQQALYDENVRNSCNYIFAFDHKQCEELQSMGLAHVYYMPLAANTTRVGLMTISKEDERKYKCDVSFIGQLYKKNLYSDVQDAVTDSTKKEIDAAIENAYAKWDGIDRINHVLSDAAIEDLTNMDEAFKRNDFRMNIRLFFETKVIAQRLAYLERIEMLKRLSKYKLKFYTTDPDVHIDGVESLSKLNYDEGLPKAYHLSKININITLHSITSGIPLRVFDIMGVGGFVLTNYQPEIEELFTPGVDLEVYHSLDEMMEKVQYYLTHDKERIRIAMNGYQKVKANYCYEKQVEHIMNQVSDSGAFEKNSR